ncbi:MAG: PQQ-binding-like beta-propeller repeat protein [Planctomycetaceae bacterium]
MIPTNEQSGDAAHALTSEGRSVSGVSLLMAGLMAGLLWMSSTSLQAGDWTRFRGENGDGVATDAAPTAVEWNDSKNLKWKVKLPGPGLSSPIIVGDRVFVTAWSGYGIDRNALGNIEQLKRHLVCVNRQSGEVLWDRPVDPVLPEEPFRGMFAENGYASHTPVSDGERVYAFYGKTGVVAYDLEGKELWRASVGTQDDPRSWGTASSPILYKELLIVPACIESLSIVGLDKRTGKEVWRQQADGLQGTWSTPILVPVDDTRTDLVVAVPYEVWGLNPETGKLRWYCDGVPSSSMCASPICHGDTVYVVGGREGGSLAVRAGGKGDVTKTHVTWKGNDRGRIGTPVFHEGRLYWISSGIANCIDAATGAKVYQSRLETNNAANADTGRRGGGGGQAYSSPVAADGKLYYVDRGGETFVLQLGPEFKQLASNRFSADEGEYSATPAISNGELFIRSTTHLYCVSAPSTAKE